MPKTYLAQLGIKAESSRGVAESVSASDVPVRLRSGYAIEPDYDLIDTDEVQGVSSKTPSIIGRRGIRFSGEYVLRGSGSLSADPAIGQLWASALFVYGNAQSLDIGAVTSGPFVPGELITGGTSSGTGTVLAHCENGDSEIIYLPVSGTLQSGETITGGASGASATTSSSPTRMGTGFKPHDPGSAPGYHSSIVGNRDGFYFQGRGCLGDLRWVFENGNPCIVSQTWEGALHSKGDQALWSVTYPEGDVVVPKFLAAECKVGSYSPAGLLRAEITWPTNPSLISDANSSSGDGVLRADYSRGLPTASLEFDQTAASAHDFFSSFDAGSTMLLRWTHGAGGSDGTKWTFSMPAAQIRGITLGESEPSRATFRVEFGLTGSNNDELLIWAH